MNVGLQSISARSKSLKSSVVAVVEVTDLKGKLERSELQGQAMREELESLKKKSEEAEAAQVARDKEHELLCKKAEETDAKLARLLELLGGSSSRN
jgi:hypothetical protein